MKVYKEILTQYKKHGGEIREWESFASVLQASWRVRKDADFGLGLLVRHAVSGMMRVLPREVDHIMESEELPTGFSDLSLPKLRQALLEAVVEAASTPEIIAQAIALVQKAPALLADHGYPQHVVHVDDFVSDLLQQDDSTTDKGLPDNTKAAVAEAEARIQTLESQLAAALEPGPQLEQGESTDAKRNDVGSGDATAESAHSRAEVQAVDDADVVVMEAMAGTSQPNAGTDLKTAEHSGENASEDGGRTDSMGVPTPLVFDPKPLIESIVSITLEQEAALQRDWLDHLQVHPSGEYEVKQAIPAHALKIPYRGKLVTASTSRFKAPFGDMFIDGTTAAHIQFSPWKMLEAAGGNLVRSQAS